MLDEKVLKMLEYYNQLMEDIKPKRASIRIRLHDRGFNAGKLAKYCDKPNRRACEDALRLVGVFFREEDVAEALKWARGNSIKPEVLIAYLYGFVASITRSINPTSEQLASMAKIRLNITRFSLSLEPLKSEFTLTDAMNLIPGLRARAS